jgi:hypothetical protein
MGQVATNPNDRLLTKLGELERRLRALESSTPQSITFHGPRSDLGGTGPRVRIGLLSDDTYGVERWAEDGTRSVPTWV